MKENGVPQPRYGAKHREHARREDRPLFTLDIWHLGDRRTTSTGVLLDSEIDEMIARLQRVKEKA